MKYLVTAEEMRRYDANTIERIGIPAMVLMERAALAASQVVREYCVNKRVASPTALILAGIGNNGGDGLALARLLCEDGFRVELWTVGNSDGASGQWREQRKILESYPVEMSTKPKRREYTVIIDALFGVGLSREIKGEYLEAVELFGELAGHRIALDVPSGVDSDTGKIWGKAVRVDETVTFGFSKRGLVLYPGCEYAGKVTVADIGISSRCFFGEEPGMFFCDEPMQELLPKRQSDGNKGTFGKVLLIAGSRNMAGAAILAAKSAYRIGAGMVKIITPEDNRVIIQETIPEALLGTPEDLAESLRWADVVAIGPGLGKDENAFTCLERVITECDKPLLIDADGLNLLVEHSKWAERLSAQGAAGRVLVLTPHVGELARLTGETVSSLKENLVLYGSALAKEMHAVVVAKDARTYVCAQGRPVGVNVSGNCGMATAGSGDVLAGIVIGMMAQGESAFEAALSGVRIHGLAGDAASMRLGEHACMAGDIIEELGLM